VSEDNTGKAHVAEISTQEIGEYAPEDQIRIVLKGFRTKVTASDLCRREDIKPGVFYAWTKEFMEAGKERLTGDTILMPPAGRSNTSSGRTTT
jgi:transposase